MFLPAMLPPAVRTAKIRQVPAGQQHNIVLKQGSRQIFLVCEDATIGEVRGYYANQVGAPGIEKLEVAITSGGETKTYSPQQSAPLPVTPAMKVIEFRQPAPAKG